MTPFTRTLRDIFNSIDNRIADGLEVAQKGINLIKDFNKALHGDARKAMLIGGTAADYASAAGIYVFATAVGMTSPLLYVIATPIAIAATIGGALAGKHYHKKLQQRRNHPIC
jgi:hypothetical protein